MGESGFMPVLFVRFPAYRLKSVSKFSPPATALTGGDLFHKVLSINVFYHVTAPQAKIFARLRVFSDFYLRKMDFGANIF